MDKKNVFFKQSWPLSILKTNLDTSQELIEAVIPEWHKVTTTPLTIDVLKGFFNAERVLQIDTLESWLLSDLADRSELPAAFNRQSMMTMLTPPDTAGLVQVLTPFEQYLESPTLKDQIYWHCFTITDGKKVERIHSKIDLIEANYFDYIENDEQADRLKLVQSVIDALTAIKSRYSIPGAALTVKGLISTDFEGTLQPSPAFIKTGNIATATMFASVRKPDSLKSTLPPPAKAMTFPDETPPEVVQAANIAARRNANRTEGIAI